MQLQIENDSSELFLRIVREVPMEPDKYKVEMVANGILNPLHGDMEGMKKYRAECEMMGVMPFTTCEFGYDFSADMFVPVESCPLRTVAGSEDLNKIKVQGFLKGGRHHTIVIRGPSGRVGGLLSAFRHNGFLEDLLGLGYKVKEGDLDLLHCEYSHQAESLHFGPRSPVILRLQEDPKSSINERVEIIDWFSALKKEYE